MPRGYRLYIAAVIGWLALTGANKPATNRPEQSKAAVEHQSAPDPQPAANTIAAAIRDTIRPAEQDRGCEQGNDQRRSDLCAQWKAADAANDAAQYGLWSVLIGLFGTGLLVWTLLETRLNARRELRAYISVKPGTLQQIGYPDKSRGMVFGYNVHNGGSTPAYNAVHSGNLVIMTREEMTVLANRRYDDAPRMGEPAPSTIHGGQTLEGDFPRHEDFTATEMDKLLNDKANLYAFGALEYTDAFSTKRITKFCFYVRGSDFRDSDLIGRANIGKPMDMQWSLAPFHNEAT